MVFTSILLLAFMKIARHLVLVNLHPFLVVRKLRAFNRRVVCTFHGIVVVDHGWREIRYNCWSYSARPISVILSIHCTALAHKCRIQEVCDIDNVLALVPTALLCFSPPLIHTLSEGATVLLAFQEPFLGDQSCLILCHLLHWLAVNIVAAACASSNR